MSGKIVYVSKIAGTYIGEGSTAIRSDSLSCFMMKLSLYQFFSFSKIGISVGYGLYPDEVKKLAKRHEILPPSYDR